MRSDFRGLSWRTLLTLVIIMTVSHLAGHATAGHGDANDAASCRSPIANRIDSLDGVGSGSHHSCEEMAGLLQQSFRSIASRLLPPDALAILRQDYEMRLCECRAVESSNKPQEEIDVFLEMLTQSEIPPADCATELVSAEDDSPFVAGVSAIESAVRSRPWGSRFTNGILFASNEPPRRLLATELSNEEYRPYDFSDLPDSLPDASVGDFVHHETESTSSDDSNPSAVLYLRNHFVWSIDTFIASLVGAIEIIDAEKLRAESLLVNHVNEAKPILSQLLGSASAYSGSFAAEPTVAVGIRMVNGWYALPVIYETLEAAMSKPVIRSVEPQDLRQVFGATILADPFQAEFSVAVKRPPTLTEPLLAKSVASRDTTAENSIMDSAESELEAVYELLVLLQSPSWMPDAIETDSDPELSGQGEIATSEISKVTPESKSASLLENSGTGVSQR